MNRRQVLAGIVGTVPVVAGCTAAGPSASPEATRTTTLPATKPGAVENHRTTAVEVLSHDAVRRATDDGHEWVLRVTLRLQPRNTETVTAYPIGIFFLVFDAAGEKRYREHKQLPANTATASRRVTVATGVRASTVGGGFDRYRIDIVHA